MKSCVDPTTQVFFETSCLCLISIRILNPPSNAYSMASLNWVAQHSVVVASSANVCSYAAFFRRCNKNHFSPIWCWLLFLVAHTYPVTPHNNLLENDKALCLRSRGKLLKSDKNLKKKLCSGVGSTKEDFDRGWFWSCIRWSTLLWWSFRWSP